VAATEGGRHDQRRNQEDDPLAQAQNERGRQMRDHNTSPCLRFGRAPDDGQDGRLKVQAECRIVLSPSERNVSQSSAFISSLHADWPRSGLVRRKSKDFFKILTDSDAVLL
jgi:hypothetical protein